MKPLKASIGYGTTTRTGRKWPRRLLICVIVIIAIYLSAGPIPYAVHRVEVLRMQAACLTLTPPTTPVIEAQSAAPDRRLVDYKFIDFGKTAYIYWTPPTWARYVNLSSKSVLPTTGQMVMVHERTSRSGVSWLVAVDAWPLYASNGIEGLSCTTFRPATFRTDPKYIRKVDFPMRHHDDAQLTIFGGTPDLSEPEKFSIRYRLGAVEHLLSGVVADDGSVSFSTDK